MHLKKNKTTISLLVMTLLAVSMMNSVITATAPPNDPPKDTPTSYRPVCPGETVTEAKIPVTITFDLIAVPTCC